MQFDALGDKLVVGHLGTQVIGLDHLIALQAIMAGIALHVHDGINTHRVGIGTCRSAHDDDLAADVLLDVLVGLVHVHRVALHLGDINGRIVHRVGAAAIAVEEGEARGQLLVEDHTGILQTHFAE